MVNVAGRSKGCSTCRKRRIKCDETRPVCRNCQLHNRPCDGPKDTIFIEAKIVSSRRKAIAIQTSPSNALTTQDGHTGHSLTAPSSMIILPQPTSPLIPDNQELCIMFTRAHLDPSGPIDTSLQALLRLGHRTSPTTQHHSNTSADITTEISTCHLTAAHSFALLFFSKSHNLPSLTHQGLQTHSQTLRTLQRLLANPQCWKHDEILITVTTLAVQETLVPTTTTTLGPAGTYMNHMLGLDRLLSLRDARHFVAPRSLQLYKCLRHLLIFACLQARRRSVFAREDWKAVMRLACRTAGLEVWEQGVYEVLAACSVLRVERDEMLARLADHDIDGADVVTRRASIHRRATALHTQLHNWKAQWDAEPALCYTESYPHPSPDSTAHTYTHAYPDFIFPTRHHAQLLILYYTTLIYVLDLLSSSASTPICSSNPNLPFTGLDPQTRLAVLHICQSMPDYSSGDGSADIHASPVAIWAMQLIVPMLQGDGSAEAKGMLGMLRRKGGTVLGSGLV